MPRWLIKPLVLGTTVRVFPEDIIWISWLSKEDPPSYSTMWPGIIQTNRPKAEWGWIFSLLSWTIHLLSFDISAPGSLDLQHGFPSSGLHTQTELYHRSLGSLACRWQMVWLLSLLITWAKFCHQSPLIELYIYLVGSVSLGNLG
jgi:hypothetical protein